MATQKTAQTFETVTAEALDISTQHQRKINPVEVALCVRVYRQNWRQGTVACKGRSDVSFSNKKPWKQKGTGRARAGSPRSPLWRKGGVVFGPQMRSRTLKTSKQSKLHVLHALLWDTLEHSKIIALNWAPTHDRVKTAYAYTLLKDANLHKRTVTLFLGVHDIQAQNAFRNLSNTRILFFDQANPYDIADGEYWVFLKKDMPLFKDMVHKWI